jgi:hypothetical protein
LLLSSRSSQLSSRVILLVIAIAAVVKLAVLLIDLVEQS